METKNKIPLDYRLMALSAKADQIGTIALVAANSSFTSEKCETIFTNILYGIESLCRTMGEELSDIAEEVM